AWLWPRPLDQGIRKVDESRFAPDTVYHPRQPARILTTRQNRVYGTTNGEEWAVEPVGNRLEIALVYRHVQPNPDEHDGHRGRVPSSPAAAPPSGRGRRRRRSASASAPTRCPRPRPCPGPARPRGRPRRRIRPTPSSLRPPT